MLGLGLGMALSARPSPALWLDFLNTTTLDSRITFTRGSSATRVNSSGLIETVATNVARFDYDPVTLAAKGLLIEEQRTNLLTYSEQFDNAAWAKRSLSGVTANAAVSPDGTANADKLVEDSTTDFRQVAQSPSLAAVQHTFSVFLKAAERTWARIVCVDGSAYINLATGALGITAAGTVSFSAQTPVYYGNGWYRVAGVFTPAAGFATVAVRLAIGNGGQTYPGDGTSGIYIWGAQLEAGAFATSYIPTVASTVTRSADVATMTGANFSSWFNASQGTLVTAFRTGTVSGTRTVCAANDTTSNESIRLRTVSTNPFLTVTDGGVDQADIDAGTVAASTVYKIAGAYTANDFAACLNGGTVGTDASGTLPTATQLVLGNSAAGNYLNGHIRSLAYYNTRLPNAQLQSLTT